MLGPANVLAVSLLTIGLTGCSLLDLLLGVSGEPPFDPDDPFPFPTTEATFTTGEATISTGGQTIVLDELVGNSGISFDGVHAVWENDDGWYMTYTAYLEEDFFPGGGYLTIERITDHEHWVLTDPSRCVTTTESAGRSGLVEGTATCRGLTWADYFTAYSSTGFPQPLPSQKPFDAEITFEAH